MGEDITLADELNETQRWCRQLETTVAQLRGRYGEVINHKEAAQAVLSDAQSEVEVLEQVTTLLQGLEAVWQKNFQKSVARVISRGLTIVFEEPMELRINTRVRADVTTVDFTIVQGDGERAIETPILGAKGGTVVALVNVLIRALLILSARPVLRRILILDEPYGLADPSYIPAFGNLMREMCDRLDFQIICVSHEEILSESADITYEAHPTKRNGTAFRQHSHREKGA